MIDDRAIIGAPPQHRDYRLTSLGIPPEIDETAIIEALAQVDAGTVRPTKVGARSYLMKMVHVGHDCEIGDDCEISPGAVLCGHVELGNRVRVGVNACIRPFIKVGDGARVGMGAVVTKDVPAGEVWVGNPARPLRKDTTGPVLTRLEEQGWEEFAARFTDTSDSDLWNEWYERSRAA